MSKKLYTAFISINIEMPIYAESPSDVIRIAKENYMEEQWQIEEFMTHSCRPMTIREAKHLFRDCIPWSDSENNMCVEDIWNKNNTKSPESE